MKILSESNTVPVPKAFFENYLNSLSLDQMRVYLFLAAFDSGVMESGEIADIALKLNMTEGTVLEVLSNLEKKGLIIFDYSTGEQIIVMLSKPFVEKEAGPNDATMLGNVERIKGRPLSNSEISALLFIKDTLGFCDELLYYLVSYCLEKERFNKDYIRKVALNWHENGVDTAEKAKLFGTKRRYDDIVYQVLFHLGRRSTPTPAEARLISEWKDYLDVSDELILYACDIAAVGTESNRLKYTSAILYSYAKAGIKTPEEARSAIKEQKYVKTAESKNSFNNFPQNKIDFVELEKQLIDN